MAGIHTQDDDQPAWDNPDDAMRDPEELKVLFCALDSFLQYAKVSHFNCTHLRRQSFYALPQDHWKMLAAPPFSFLETLDRVDAAIESNADLARQIVRFGQEFFRAGSLTPAPSLSADPVLPPEWTGAAKFQDVDKARSTIRQFYRDWSAEGAAERAQCYGPVMRALAHERGLRQQRHASLAASDQASGGLVSPLKVLVPGAGLGRLVFDLCCAGYETEGNEISYHQLVASSYVLNYTTHAGQHTIFPWVHTFSNHKTRENHLRSCRIPDLHPGRALAAAAAAANGGSESDDSQRSRPGVGSMSMCAADFLCLYSDDEHAAVYDAVACVFFLDTAPNLIRYLETIQRCLKPGGLLLNVGPLLWHFENHAPGNHGRDDDGDGEHDASCSSGVADPGSFELADDEVMALVQRLGFDIVSHESGVETPYIHDDQSMLQTVYRSSSWVARKPWD